MLRIRSLEAIPYGWVVVSLWFLAMLPVAFIYMGLGVLFPFLQQDLNTNLAQLGLIASSLGVGAGVTVFMLGWLVDLFGVRRLESAGLLGAAIGLFLFSQIHSVVQGIAVAAFIGVFLAVTGPGYAKAITDWVRPRTRALAMGITEAVIPVGAIISAVLLTFLSVTYSWRVALIVVGVMSAVVSMVFFAFYRDKPSAARDRRQGPGRTLPLVVKNRDIWVAATFGIVSTGLISVLMAYLVLFMREDLNRSAGGAAGLLAFAHVGSVVGRIGWGLVSDLLLRGRRAVTLASAGALAMVCMAFLALLPSDAPLAMVLVLMFFVGITALGMTGLQVVLVTELAGPGLTGTAVGLNIMIMQVGGFGITPLFGLIVDRTDSYSLAWWMMAGVAGAGTAVLATLRPRPRPG